MISNEHCSSLSASYRSANRSSIPNSQNGLNQIITLSPMGLPTPKSIPSTPCSRYTRRKHTSVLSHEIRNVFSRKPRLSIEATMAMMGYRIRMSKFLNARLALVSDIMCFLGITGLVLMIAENELTFNRVNNGDTQASWSIKLIISATTTMLLGLICYYHYLDLKLYTVRNALEEIRVGITKSRICWFISEIVICAVHPMPRSSPHLNSELLSSYISLNSTHTRSLSYTAVDVGLGLPMFLRLYLLGRSVMFHSHLFRDASLRSINCLNQVSINFFFLLKTYLEQWPVRCLMTFCIIAFFIGSWCLRACSYKSTGEHFSLPDAMWLFIITFTTIGYGDVYPTSYCGRGIASLTGLIGLLVSALLITVLTQKLHLTREEKYVHTFVLNTELAKERQNHAANVVKFSIKIWFYKRQNKMKYLPCLHAQRHLFQSISNLKQIKKTQRYLTDHCVDLHEVMTVQRNTNAQNDETIQQMTEMKCDMKQIEAKLNNITNRMDNLQMTLNMLLNR
ncbi:unnamed protein product [Adineta steineri]|uniref:Calmodulin-binding domain-containing protein n=1 Tax=Adineta steineri TaxID=433720 RepID=A0A815ADD7_9BILA|nr:unnamed protein product [Adineta steineri]CAF1546424.1 unnamed protein product [Adineta steineri]